MAENTLEKPYEWQLYFREQWSTLENDHIIEANYCQPGAQGITISTHFGDLYIDFDAMTVSGPYADFMVKRAVFLLASQAEDMKWYYKDNYSWCEYGLQGSSVNSQNLEQLYQSNPTGAFNFTVGSTSYIINFSGMVQTNQSTRMTRKVRRRPNFYSTVISSPVLSPSSRTYTPNLTPASVVSWEFLDNEGIWKVYQKPGSSLDSVDIEAQYQLNPLNQLTFTAGRYLYTLCFSEMCQINSTFGTRRTVRRNITGNQHNSSGGSHVRWQYLDGRWRDFVKGGVRGQCTVSSQEIEYQYQQNRTGIMRFSTGKFNYTIDFAAMIQTNLSTNTQRNIQRLESP